MLGEMREKPAYHRFPARGRWLIRVDRTEARMDIGWNFSAAKFFGPNVSKTLIAKPDPGGAFMAEADGRGKVPEVPQDIWGNDCRILPIFVMIWKSARGHFWKVLRDQPFQRLTV